MRNFVRMIQHVMSARKHTWQAKANQNYIDNDNDNDVDGIISVQTWW